MGIERKLYELRTNMGLTLEQAAVCIGIHKSTLCRYEQSFPRYVRKEVMDRICALYQVPQDYLRKEDGMLSDTWFRLMSPEEAAAVYAALPEREQLRFSRLLEEAERNRA